MTNKISQVLSFEAKDAITALGQVKTGLDDVESAGKQVALALEQTATNMEADLKGTAAAADALGEALGPELAGKIGRSGVEDFVVKLKGIGLTSDQIVTDVDSLAASIKHLDDVGRNLDGPKQGLRDVGDAADHAQGQLHKVGGEADNSRSVLANMAGNSTQDLANIGGAAGTAGLALGQMAEYATEGNISLGGLAKVVGPMAAITVATLALTQGAKQAAEAEKKLTEEIGKLSTATDEQVLAGLTQMMIDQFVAGHDLADIWTKIAETNIEGARRLEDLMVKQGMTTTQTKGLTDAIAVQDEATRRAADTAAEYGDKVALAVPPTDALARGTDILAGATEGAKQQFDDASPSVDQFTQKVQAADGAYSHLIGKLDEEDAWQKAQVSIMGFASTVDPTAEDVRNLTRDLADYVHTTETIPAEKKTKYLAELDQGQLDFVEQQLAILARNRNINLDIVAKGGAGFFTGAHGAEGGIVKARPGGQLILAGEAGSDEALIPLDGKHGVGAGATGLTVNVFVSGHVMTERDLVRAVADGIVDGQRRGEITAGFLVSP